MQKINYTLLIGLVVVYVLALAGMFFLKSKINPKQGELKIEFVYDTICVYDTMCIDVIEYDTIYHTVYTTPQKRHNNWTGAEKIEFVKYVNTQQRLCNQDQWAVIQVMLNILDAWDCNWTEYSYNLHHEGSFFDNCRAGKIWSYTYNPNISRDSIIMARLNLALEGKVPEESRIPANIIAFESHRDPNWNSHVKKGLWQRSMIGLTLDHEYYYDWSKVTDEERDELLANAIHDCKQMDKRSGRRAIL